MANLALIENSDNDDLRKKCGSCKKLLPLSDFNKDKATSHGLACYCKKCNKKRNEKTYKIVSQNFEWKVEQALRASKNRAKAKGIEHTLTLEQLKSLFPPDNICPVFGFEMSWGFPKWSSPSIDRIDSTSGYTYENCQIISNKANVLKNDGTVEEFEKLLSFMKEHGNR